MRLLFVALLLIGSANAAVVQVDAHDQGRFSSRYYVQTPLEFFDDVSVGGIRAASSAEFPYSGSHYQVFDLSDLSGSVESATFSIWLGVDGYTYEANQPPPGGGTVNLYAGDNIYSVGAFRFIDEVLSVRDGEVDFFAYFGEPAGSEALDLGSQLPFGYGEAVVREADEGSWIDVALSPSALTDINESLGGTFAIAGGNEVVYCWNSMGTDEGYCEDRMFDSPDSGFGKLTLTGSISVVPVPAAVWLFGSALIGLGWFRSRSKAFVQ